MPAYDLPTLIHLQEAAQTAIYERGKRYGTIGVPTSGGWSIPSDERGKRLVTVTLDDGVQVRADASAVTPLAGSRVWLYKEGQQWVVKGNDPRGLTEGTTGVSGSVPKHNDQIGNPLFVPIDPASANDGLIRPSGSGLNVVIGRVTYPKLDGTIGIYDSADTLDLASAVTGLDAGQSRWAVHYINRSTGAAAFHSPPVGTAPLNATTDIEAAIADCLSSAPVAYPYAVSRIRAGQVDFGAYQPMQGLEMSSKDHIRLGLAGALPGEPPWPLTLSYDRALYANTQIVLSQLTVASGATLTIESGALMEIIS